MELSKYDTEVQQYVKDLISDLQLEVGELPKSYNLQIELLAQAVQIYIKAYKSLNEEGLTILDSRGGKVKNPNVSIWNAAGLTIHKILNQFIMTRSAKQKLKSTDDNAAPIDDFI